MHASGFRVGGRSRASEGHIGIGVAGVEGVVVGEDHFFGAVGAEGGLVVAVDDGECVEDVGGLVSPPFLDRQTAPSQD